MLGLLLPVISAGINAYSRYQAGKRAGAASEAEARAAEANALLSERSAAEALARGNREALGSLGRASGITSEQSLVGATSGLSMESGVVSGAFDESLYLSELDAIMARRNARLDYDASMTEAGMFRSGAKTAREAGASARKEAMFGVFGSLATGGIGAWDEYDKWSRGKKSAKKAADATKVLP